METSSGLQSSTPKHLTQGSMGTGPSGGQRLPHPASRKGEKVLERAGHLSIRVGATLDPQPPRGGRTLWEWRCKMRYPGAFSEMAAAVQQNTKTPQILILAALSLTPHTD